MEWFYYNIRALNLVKLRVSYYERPLVSSNSFVICFEIEPHTIFQIFAFVNKLAASTKNRLKRDEKL